MFTLQLRITLGAAEGSENYKVHLKTSGHNLMQAWHAVLIMLMGAHFNCLLLFLVTCKIYKSVQWKNYLHVRVAINTRLLPVIMLEMMRGKITSFNILIRSSPGKPKYFLSRWESVAYSLTNTPSPIPVKRICDAHTHTHRKPFNK